MYVQFVDKRHVLFLFHVRKMFSFKYFAGKNAATETVAYQLNLLRFTSDTDRDKP